VAAKLAEIRARIDLPVGVGFGIRDAATAAQVAEHADAVIVGSAIVGRIEALADAPERISDEIGAFLTELRTAIDEVSHG
jgi:tryptophan synthase alpha chain